MAAKQEGAFKRRHFASDVILWALRWYLAFPISYRDSRLDAVGSRRGCATEPFAGSSRVARGYQTLPRQSVGWTWEQRVAIDEVEQRHRLATEAADDMAVVDDMSAPPVTAAAAPTRRAGLSWDARTLLDQVMHIDN